MKYYFIISGPQRGDREFVKILVMYKLRTHAFDRMPQIEILGDSRSVKPTHGPTPTPGGSRKRESSPGEPRRQNPAQEVPRDQPWRPEEVPGSPRRPEFSPGPGGDQNPAQECLGRAESSPGDSMRPESSPGAPSSPESSPGVPGGQNPAQEPSGPRGQIQTKMENLSRQASRG